MALPGPAGLFAEVAARLAGRRDWPFGWAQDRLLAPGSSFWRNRVFIVYTHEQLPFLARVPHGLRVADTLDFCVSAWTVTRIRPSYVNQSSTGVRLGARGGGVAKGKPASPAEGEIVHK